MQQQYTSEIDQLGKAFITISSHEYTPMQMQAMYRFLSHYGNELEIDEIEKTFKDKSEIIDALKVLFNFATHHQKDEEVYEEFLDEVDNLLITINQNEEGLIL